VVNNRKNVLTIVLILSMVFVFASGFLTYVYADEIDEFMRSSQSVVFVDGVKGNDDNTGGIESPCRTIKKAYEILKNTGGTISIINTVTCSEDNIDISANYWSNGYETITLDEGKKVSIIRYNNNSQRLFNITKGTVNLKESIVIDGNNVSSSACIFNIEKMATLNIYDAVLKNNQYSSVYRAAVENYGVLNMYGGSIENNSKSIINNGDLYIEDGVISGNGAGITNKKNFCMNGGCIMFTGDDAVANTGTFTMAGGKILNTMGNAVDNYKAVFNFEDGLISDSTSSAIYNRNGAQMVMYGGIIENNISENEGGGISNYSSNLTIEGGIIRNNEAYQGGGIDFYDYEGGHKFTMNGGNIIGNKSASNGGGINLTAQNQTTTLLNGGTISNNTASNGAGIYVGARSM